MTIGGTVSGSGNVISGNITGVYFNTGTADSVIEGNYIGTDKTGTVAVPNDAGIGFENTPGGNTIGGPTSAPGTGAGNLIAGNSRLCHRISLESSVDVIAGNLIGVGALSGGGSSPANAGGIKDLDNSGLQIGGPSPLDQNVISGNIGYGIWLDDSTTTLVQGNLIGTNLAGTAASPNGIGVLIATGSLATRFDQRHEKVASSM